MLERYDDLNKDSDSSSEELDEFLCEYVDGSMDPAVKDAFEEVLASNPKLADHVACLCRTRNLLAHHSRCPVSGDSLQQRLHLEIARDLMGETSGAEVRIANRLSDFAYCMSAFVLMVLLGVLFGSAIVPPVPSTTEFAAERSRLAAPSDAHTVPVTPIAPRTSANGKTLLVPVQSLPVLKSSSSITPVPAARTSEPPRPAVSGR